MKVVCMAFLVVFACSVIAQGNEYAWNPSEKQTVFGKATIEYAQGDDPVVKRLSIEDVGGGKPVVFTGDDAFTFAAGGMIDLVNGVVQFKTPLVASDLSINFNCSETSSTQAFDQYLYKTGSSSGAQLLFPGKSINDYEVVEAYFLTGALQGPVRVFGFARREDGWLSLEAQTNQSNLAKGARITLYDGDGGIYGSIDHVGYYSGDVFSVSLDDVEALRAKGGNHLPVIREAEDKSGYGVRSLSIAPIGVGNKVTVNGSSCQLDSVALGKRTKMTFEDVSSSVLSADYTLGRDSHFTVRDAASAHLTGSFSANNAVVSFENASPEDLRDVRTLSIEKGINKINGELLLENARVDEITQMDVEYLLNSVDSTKKPTVCFQKRSHGKLEFQVQVADGGWLKGSQIELYQNGAHIFARWICSMYSKPEYGPAGTLDMLSSDVVLEKKYDGGSVVYYYPGKINLTLPEESVLSKKLSIDCIYEKEDGSGGTTNIFDKVDEYSAVRLLKNTRLEDITGIYVDKLVGSVSDGPYVPLYCFEKRSPGKIEFQLQVRDRDPAYTKGGCYVLEQRGVDIYAYRVRSYYVKTNLAPKVGVWDFTSPAVDGVNSTANPNYLPVNIDVYILNRPAMEASIAGLGNTSSGNVLNIGSNVTYEARRDGQTSSLSSKVTVNVDGTLNVAGSGAIGSGEINVRKGGMLTISGANTCQYGTDQRITFDGGWLYSFGKIDDGENYLNQVVLRNGALLYGAGLRIGVKDVTWIADGNGPSYVQSHLKFVSGFGGINPDYTREFVMTWKVEDATGDESTDLFVNGNLSDFEDGGSGSTPNGGMVHLKDGEGTLRWGGVSSCTGLVRVVRGTLLLGNDKALNTGNGKGNQYDAKQPVEIAGGTLAVEQSLNCTAQSLSLSASGSIALGDNASLVVDRAGVFSQGARLQVSLGEGAVFKFSSPLTVSQLRAIKLNEGRVRQLPDGSICEVPPQLKLILR